MTGSGLIVALEDLRTELRRLGAPVAWNLRPGLGREEVQKLAAPLPYRLSDDIATLFMWHDGADGEPHRGDLDIVPGGQFHNLSTVIGHYQRRNKFATEADSPGFPAGWFWDPTALPIFPPDKDLYMWVALCGESTTAGTPCGMWSVVDHCIIELYQSLADLIRHTSNQLANGDLEHDPILGLVRTSTQPVTRVREWPT